MAGTLTYAERSRSLAWLVGHGALNNAYVYMTVFGSMFIVFLDKLGLSKSEAGLLVSMIPLFCLISPFVQRPIGTLGPKRLFVLCWTIRSLLVLPVALTPWVMIKFGNATAIAMVAAMVAGVAISRTVGMIGCYRWQQEIIPPDLRGRFLAVNTVVCTLAAVISTGLISAALALSESLWTYSLIMIAGGIFGLASTYAAAQMKGGAPFPAHETREIGLKSMLATLKDRNFTIFQIGLALLSLATVSLGTFLPLFMKERVGLSASEIILLDTAAMIAAVVGSWPWGWLADRVGSKPIVLVSLWLMLLFPVGLLLLPPNTPLIVVMAMLFLNGLVAGGWGIGSARILYNTILPHGGPISYSTMHVTISGGVAGLSAIFGGFILDAFRNLDTSIWGIHLDKYAPLILGYPVLLMLGALLLSAIRTKGEMSAFDFAGTLIRGDLFETVRSVINYNLVGDELRRVVTVEQLGGARSALNVEELVDSLADPSFNVRFEAAVSIARTRPDPRLTDALIAVLRSDEPDLAIIAAWGLGRLGDPRAMEPLRKAVLEGTPLLAARCGRALALLGDRGSVPLLLARLRAEDDDRIRVSYAAAIASLGSAAATLELLAFLADAKSDAVRHELTLALARILGSEELLVRHWRRVRRGGSATMADTVKRLSGKISAGIPIEELRRVLDQASTDLAAENADAAARAVAQLLASLPAPALSAVQQPVVDECARRLSEWGIARVEYFLLALVALEVCGRSVPLSADAETSLSA